MLKSFICKRIFMPCNLFQKLNSMPKIFLRNDIFHSNLIDKNFNVHVLYQNEYVKSAVQVQFPEEMYAISLGQQIHSRKKNEYYSHFFTVKWFLNTACVHEIYKIRYFSGECIWITILPTLITYMPYVCFMIQWISRVQCTSLKNI